MYKIRGADGKEYGPVSAGTVRDWVNQGRANGQTLVLAEGTAEWKPLSSYADFAALLTAATPATRGAPSGTSAGPVKTSAMAIWSLVLAILGCTAPIGLILGTVALSKIKRSEGRLGGRGLALAGVIVSSCLLAVALLAAVPAALLLPALAKAKSKAQSINCVNNVKQLSLAIRIYSSDNNENFPAATNWCDAISVNVGAPKVFVCPSSPSTQSGYAYNAKLSGVPEGKIDPQTVMIFESDAGWNATGGKEVMITQPRHNGRFIIGFADGSVQQLTAAQVGQLRWDPQPATEANQTSD